MKENYLQHDFIEQIERFKVQLLSDSLSTNSKLKKWCGFAVFRDVFIVQVDPAMTIKNDILCSPNRKY